MTKRNVKYGNDFFKEVKSGDLQHSYKACYWDLWIALVLTNKFDKNWNALIEAIEPEHYNKDNYRAISNHIKNLNNKLTSLGIDISDILIDSDSDFLKKQIVKARKKVLNLDFQQNEKTKWMINTPKKLLYEKALNGNWQDFPVNPTIFTEILEKKFKKTGYYTKGETFKLMDKLTTYFDKNTKKADIPKLIAVYRAFLSVVPAKMDMIDDSYGIIGTMYQDIFEEYTKIDRSNINMTSKMFLTDVLELMIWEDYGGIDIYKTKFFENLLPEEVSLTEAILKVEAEILWSNELNYVADNTLTMLAILYAQHKMFDKFIPLAKELETRAWYRIVILTETAIENGKHDLALQVFEACLVPGDHYNYLKEKYEKLKC